MDDSIRNILAEHPSIPPEKLLAYLEGRLEGHDRIEVEMAMIESDFLSDAAEGLGAIRQPAQIPSMVEDLNRRLRRKTRHKYRPFGSGHAGFPFWLTFAAILLLILILAGFFILRLMSAR